MVTLAIAMKVHSDDLQLSYEGRTLALESTLDMLEPPLQLEIQKRVFQNDKRSRCTLVKFRIAPGVDWETYMGVATAKANATAARAVNPQLTTSRKERKKGHGLS